MNSTQGNKKPELVDKVADVIYEVVKDFDELDEKRKAQLTRYVADAIIDYLKCCKACRNIFNRIHRWWKKAPCCCKHS